MPELSEMETGTTDETAALNKKLGPGFDFLSAGN
jgi:hypothetical protein